MPRGCWAGLQSRAARPVDLLGWSKEIEGVAIEGAPGLQTVLTMRRVEKWRLEPWRHRREPVGRHRSAYWHHLDVYVLPSLPVGAIARGD
jgi:hypothetical protein